MLIKNLSASLCCVTAVMTPDFVARRTTEGRAERQNYKHWQEPEREMGLNENVGRLSKERGTESVGQKRGRGEEREIAV